jgi:hypothetical protein
MTDAIKAGSDLMSERDLDCVSAGIKGAVEGVCRKEATSGKNDPAQMFQQILQQLSGQ